MLTYYRSLIIPNFRSLNYPIPHFLLLTYTTTDLIDVVNVKGRVDGSKVQQLDRQTSKVEAVGKATERLPTRVTQELVDGAWIIHNY